MPEFSLEKPPTEKVRELAQELHKQGLEPRLTFLSPINETRKNALEMIRDGKPDPKMVVELLESTDFIEREAGAYLSGNITGISEKDRPNILSILEELGKSEDFYTQKVAIRALGNQGEEALPILEELSKDKDSDVRKAVARALGNQGEKALPILKELSRDEDRYVRGEAVLALGNQGEKALPILKELSKDKDSDVRKAVARALGNQGEKALPILEELSKNEHYDVRAAVAQVLGNQGEKALPILKELSKDKNPDVRKAVARALGNQGEKALPILKKLSQDEDPYVQKAAIEALDKMEGKYKWLLATRKPLFATSYTEELAERISNIQEIVRKLKEEFGDDFVGLVILGSTSKGYFARSSDLDWGIIAGKKEVSERFKEMAAARSLNLCLEHFVNSNEEYQVQEGKAATVSFLFCGLFFGDYDRLLEIQEKLLRRINPKIWDEIRREILANETRLAKAQERFGLEDQESEKTKQAVALLRVPPPYQEALRIVQRRRH